MPDFVSTSLPSSIGSSSSSDAVQCTLTCKNCHTSIASQDCLLSTSFRGHAGKAALYSEVSNTAYKPPCILLMNTGAHTVQELACASCTAYLGWKIVRAHEQPERWKEGHCLLELSLLEESILERPPAESPKRLDTVVSRFAASLDVFDGHQSRRASSSSADHSGSYSHSLSKRGRPHGPRSPPSRASLPSTRSTATL